MSDPITLDGKLMFPSNYIGAADLPNGEQALTISDVENAELRMESGRKESKPVLHFKERPDKSMVLNKTNGRSIARATGLMEMRSWVGKRIILYATTCRFGRDPKYPCVRVREEEVEAALASAPSPPRVLTADAAKAKAWQAYKSLNHGMDTKAMQASFTIDCQHYFQTGDFSTVRADEWSRFVADGFVIPASDVPV